MPPEILRSNANHRVGNPVELHCGAEHVGPAPELLEPKPVADHGYRVLAKSLVLLRDKRSSPGRANPEEIEIRRRYVHREHAGPGAAHVHAHLLDVPASQMLERCLGSP
jgi:hypothetical protein